MAIIFLVGLFSFIQSGSKPNNVLALTSTDIFGPSARMDRLLEISITMGKLPKTIRSLPAR